MSSPMYDVPEHLIIPVNRDGDGPVPDAEFDHYDCWCADPKCAILEDL